MSYSTPRATFKLVLVFGLETEFSFRLLLIYYYVHLNKENLHCSQRIFQFEYFSIRNLDLELYSLVRSLVEVLRQVASGSESESVLCPNNLREACSNLLFRMFAFQFFLLE